MTPELILAIAVVAIVVLSLGVHEAAHAWVAMLHGDTTARDEGRLTLNPIAHIDPFGTVVLPALLWMVSSGSMVFGYARPVPVVASRLRHPLRDMVWVALAGPVSNFLIGALLFVLWKTTVQVMGYPAAALLPKALMLGAMANILLGIFNLIPIPPLDGSRVMTYLLPSGLREPYNAFGRFGILILFGIIWLVPGGFSFLYPALDGAWVLLDTLTGGSWK